MYMRQTLLANRTRIRTSRLHMLPSDISRRVRLLSPFRLPPFAATDIWRSYEVLRGRRPHNAAQMSARPPSGFSLTLAAVGSTVVHWVGAGDEKVTYV
jgi:hypothetical protein